MRNTSTCTDRSENHADVGSPTILHIPHSSVLIPASERSDILLDDAALARELLAMTDAHTELLFRPPPSGRAVVFPISRLVVDPERFEDDEAESMAVRGMGVIYTRTSSGGPLRIPPTSAVRQRLLDAYYRPHHARLRQDAAAALEQWGRCLVIDCHSFPSRPLPYETDRSIDRPDICIGTDPFHTSERLTVLCETECRAAGFIVARNRPFAGALVPTPYFGTDQRVSAVMLEVNRRLYMDEATGKRLPQFNAVAEAIGRIVRRLDDSFRRVSDGRH